MGRTDVLRTIRDAEADAEATSKKAEKDADGLITKARADAAKNIIAAQDEITAEVQSMIGEARAAADKEADVVSVEGESALKAVQKQGKKHRSAAVDSVLDTFLA